MKTVFSNDQLAHVWAQRSQTYGKSNSMRFDGAVLYSYDAKIAKFQAGSTGEVCAALVTSRTYSVTTTSHTSRALGAVRGLGIPVFRVPNVDPRTDTDHLENYNALIAGRDAALKASERARSDWRRDMRRSDAERLDSDAAAYAALFVKGDPAKLAKRLARESAKAERERKQREAERAAALEAAKVRLAPIIDELRATWRACGDWSEAWHRATCAARDGGADQYFMRNIFDSVTLLRVNGDKVETSRGAEFPVEHARRAFRLLAPVVHAGKPWTAGKCTNDHDRYGGSFGCPDCDGAGNDKRNVVRLGHFTVDRVEIVDGAAVVVAGCHRVAWSEVEHCARELGLLDVASAP